MRYGKTAILEAAQDRSPIVQQSPAPSITTTTTSQAVDFTSIFSSIMPLLMVVLMFSIIKPLFTQLGGMTTAR